MVDLDPVSLKMLQELTSTSSAGVLEKISFSAPMVPWIQTQFIFGIRGFQRAPSLHPYFNL